MDRASPIKRSRSSTYTHHRSAKKERQSKRSRGDEDATKKTISISPNKSKRGKRVPSTPTKTGYRIRSIKETEFMKTLDGKYVEVRESPIHGRGVFALMDIPAGRILGYYKGELISNTESNRRLEDTTGKYNVDYMYWLSERYTIDAGVEETGNWARYMNDPQGTGKHANVYFGDKASIVVGKKPIKAGDELLIRYGKDYWEQRMNEMDRVTRAVEKIKKRGGPADPPILLSDDSYITPACDLIEVEDKKHFKRLKQRMSKSTVSMWVPAEDYDDIPPIYIDVEGLVQLIRSRNKGCHSLNLKHYVYSDYDPVSKEDKVIKVPTLRYYKKVDGELGRTWSWTPAPVELTESPNVYEALKYIFKYALKEPEEDEKDVSETRSTSTSEDSDSEED